MCTLDFESATDSYTGIFAGHRWYEPIVLTLTDSQGFSDSWTIYMHPYDSSQDGEITVSLDTYSGSWLNFQDEVTLPLWRG